MEQVDQLASLVPLLLGGAWLLPLASFTLIFLFGPKMGRHGRLAAYVATGAILGSFVLSITSFTMWLAQHGVTGAPTHASHDAESQQAAAEKSRAFLLEPSTFDPAANHFTSVAYRTDDHHEEAGDDADHLQNDHHGHGTGTSDHGHAAHQAPEKVVYTGSWYPLYRSKTLLIDIGYYIDILTVSIFCMVTLIASCIHFYSIGYMHEELTDELVDNECKLPDGTSLRRRGRFHRFFQYLSLFCFSMLGLVIAGNVAMVFVFWELVGICSYLLIGFYRERHSASTAANKAFIVNRVGDFGMIIGLMALWGSLGTFAFGDVDGRPGVFTLVTQAPGGIPNGMVRLAAYDQIEAGVQPTDEQLAIWREQHLGYGLLIVAGLGIFCGCVGKSAQFPLHVWLPDAMEGPTPVSALIHAATMVAAGVYLVGRFYPVFSPEVLLVIAYIGAITLFLAATIAIAATDIKRVLAYSTVSQLGYMMLALGVGGWLAGLFHLVTHAFFKALLFLCSGSVIHACHTNEMPLMGGLRKKMPWTAYTMLVGCLAISGAGIPFVIGFSGYYSKDAIIAQVLSFSRANPAHAPLYWVAAGGAAITAFYMFRLWFMTFAGKPRDTHIYEHAHESPKVMYVPLVILAIFATGVAWRVPGTNLSLANLIEDGRPVTSMTDGVFWSSLRIPNEHLSHSDVGIHTTATLVAFGTALSGFLLALLFYGTRTLNAEEVQQQFPRIHRFLINRWYIDDLYWAIFVRPTHFIAQRVAAFDRQRIDWFIDSTARWVRGLSRLDDLIDRYVVDGFVNLLATWTYGIGLSLRRVQTGRLRQYVMFIAVGTVALFVLASFLWSYAMAGS